jgi:hypothetical protein
MRLTLILICLFSILGGCAASSSHGVVVPKLVSYSSKHQTSSSITIKVDNQPIVNYAGADAGYFDADDIEDDVDNDNFSFKKLKPAVKYALTHTHAAASNSLRRCRQAVAVIQGNASPKYIAHKTIRV